MRCYKKIRLYRAIFTLLLLSSVLRFDAFFNGAHRYIPYRVTIITLFFYIIYSSLKNESILKSNLKEWLAYSITICVISLSWLLSFESFVAFTNNILSFLFIIGGTYLFIAALKRCDPIFVLNFRVTFLLLSCLIFTLECFIRFKYPELGLDSGMDGKIISQRMADGVSTDNFFYFKYGSIMFFDSNYIGLNLLPLVILTLSHHKYRSIFLVWLVLLVLFSLSRSAWVGLLFIFTLWGINRPGNLGRFLMGISLIAIPFAIILVYEIVKNDPSFLTKIAIFNSLELITEVSYVELFFGFGLVEGPFIYSPNENAYAHALLPLLLGQVGIVGTFIYFFTWLLMCKRFGFPVFLAFIILNLCGISLADPWEVIYFYVPIYASFVRQYSLFAGRKVNESHASYTHA
ncbi:hypothetical protein [Pseudoalteromonas sp. Q18-MNA-CIBAN-0097]|uniref:hypothetical protein n=1 Tax=Pseudoalteromonas sp. Q18-MNA-CIBAN-0097 TaxID=3140440 RepID=UPI00332918B3